MTGAPAPRSWWNGSALAYLCHAMTAGTFVFLLVIGARSVSWIHPDCCMYLHTGAYILDGQVPYVDFVDVNPPLVMYLHVIPVWIARVTGYPLVSVFNTLVSLLAGVGALAITRYLSIYVPRLSVPHRNLCAATMLGFSFLIFIAGQWVLPTAAHGTDYGQREHLILLGYLPLLLLRMARFSSPGARFARAEAILVGALGGVMLCLKPHFIGAALLVEIHLVLAHKRVRPLWAPEALAAMGVPILYLAHFLFLPSAMREAFFGRWLPLASSRYSVYDWSWEHVFGLQTLHVATLLFVLVWLPYTEPYRGIARRAAPIATFTIGCALVLISQHKGWPYHVIPITGGIFLTCVVVAAEVMQRQADVTPAAGGGFLARVQRVALAVRVPLVIVLLNLWMLYVVRQSPHLTRPYRSPTLDLVRKHTQESDSVTYITTAVQGPYPDFFHAQRGAGTRYLWTFPIAYLFAGHPTPEDPKAPYVVPAGREEEERRLIADLADDIRTRRPKLIFVWQGVGCQGCRRGFVIAAYLRQAGFEEEALADYFETRTIGSWVVYARGDVTDLPRVRDLRRPTAR